MSDNKREKEVKITAESVVETVTHDDVLRDLRRGDNLDFDRVLVIQVGPSLIQDRDTILSGLVTLKSSLAMAADMPPDVLYGCLAMAVEVAQRRMAEIRKEHPEAGMMFVDKGRVN